jgi:hypothetical protein
MCWKRPRGGCSHQRKRCRDHSRVRGDGSVKPAVAGLIGTKRPLAIIPGGTANVLAKVLGMPHDTMEALKLLRDGHYWLKTIKYGCSE